MLITLCCPEFVQLFYDSICIKVVSWNTSASGSLLLVWMVDTGRFSCVSSKHELTLIRRYLLCWRHYLKMKPDYIIPTDWHFWGNTLMIRGFMLIYIYVYTNSHEYIYTIVFVQNWEKYILFLFAFYCRLKMDISPAACFRLTPQPTLTCWRYNKTSVLVGTRISAFPPLVLNKI